MFGTSLKRNCRTREQEMHQQGNTWMVGNRTYDALRREVLGKAFRETGEVELIFLPKLDEITFDKITYLIMY